MMTIDGNHRANDTGEQAAKHGIGPVSTGVGLASAAGGRRRARRRTIDPEAAAELATFTNGSDDSTPMNRPPSSAGWYLDI